MDGAETQRNNEQNNNERRQNESSKFLCYFFVPIITASLLGYFYYLKKEQTIPELNEFIEPNEESQILKNELNRQNELKFNFLKNVNLFKVDQIYPDEKIREKIKHWKNIYNAYIGIERFSIPVISTINAGKSSILNYILNLINNVLQIGEKVTTKFCVIVRHNKNYKEGRIFNVTIEKRADINKYNFRKGNEIKENIKDFIKKRNELISQYQNSNQEIKDPSLYFIILEIDTGLFEGEFEKYAELVEFIDIPGLNEVGGDKNFYFRNVLPFIKMNFLYPLIIIDSMNFDSSDVFKVFRDLFEPYISEYLKNNFQDKFIQYDIDNQKYALEKIKNNSLFIINKLNMFEKNRIEEVRKKIIDQTSKEFNYNLSLGNNC